MKMNKGVRVVFSLLPSTIYLRITLVLSSGIFKNESIYNIELHPFSPRLDKEKGV